MLAAGVAGAAAPVMVVNGIEVNDVEIAAAKQAVGAQLRGQTADETMITRRAVDQVIARVLLGAAAREAKVQADEAKVEAALEQQRKMAGGAAGLAESLKHVGLSEAELRRITAETLAVREYIETVLLADLTVTDADLEAYYKEHPKEFEHPEQVKLWMILLEAKPSADETTRAAARAKAESIHKRLVAGEDFATLARQFSEDPTKANGGEIGWVGKGRLLPELEPAVFALAPGATSEVLTSSYGFHIFRVEARKPAGISSLAEVKDNLRTFLHGRKAEARVREKVDVLRAKARIVYLDPALEAAVLGRSPAHQPTSAAPVLPPR
ncbi:MAG TPA: peptidylprolyl isomerase [Thermoanaerobaculaceae bacterium]|nr:peptidylprolyl isomerase [Thermoanaerobaculaceae bacterium]